MNQEIKKEWVEALRSGKYEQGKNVLRSADNKYCCLGVLCDIVKDKVGLTWKKRTNEYAYRIDSEERILPQAVVDFTKIKSVNPRIPYSGEYESLALLNDNGSTFEELAKLIEEKL